MTALHPTPSATLKPTGLPVQQFIECVRCLDASLDDSSVQEWAEEHHSRKPGHDTFRTVNTASWRLVPRETCGAQQTYPTDPDELARYLLPASWAGVVVTCSEAPHGDETAHSGRVIVNGESQGTAAWGPGFVSMR